MEMADRFLRYLVSTDPTRDAPSERDAAGVLGCNPVIAAAIVRSLVRVGFVERAENTPDAPLALTYLGRAHIPALRR